MFYSLTVYKVSMMIGFVGKIGSGKDTASDYLIEKYGFVSLKLSDVITDELMQLGIDSTRENKQIMGTKMRSEHGKDVLMRKLFDKVERGKNYIFNGVRHPEEAEFLRRKGGFLVKIDCNPKMRFERTKKRDKIDLKEFQTMDNRESEKAIEEIRTDFTIDNSRNLESLHKQLDNLIKKIS